MKKKYIFKYSLFVPFIILPIFFSNVKAQNISEREIDLVAEKWFERMGYKKFTSYDISNKQVRSYHGDTTFVIVNSKKGGFVIISKDINSIPILAYSRDGEINLNNITPQTETLFRNYDEQIQFIRKNGLQVHENVKRWNDIKNKSKTKTLSTVVGPLLENTNSSRWAGWRPYFNQAPSTCDSCESEGAWACVPLATSQIMKYYNWPYMGNGSKSYTWNSSTLSLDFSRQIYDYSNMPFRLTYCGNGEPGCDDGSFDIIPGVTEDQIDEIGKLQYHAGISHNMNWLGNRGTGCGTCTGCVSCGTYGTPNDWADDLIDHFRFNSSYTYHNISVIDSSSFKSDLRDELDLGRPVLMQLVRSSGGNHAVIIDGYEDTDYFHINMGWGGDRNYFYALFLADIDIDHPDTLSGRYRAVTALQPDCPTVNNVIQSTTTTISSTGSGYYEAKENLTISNMTIEGSGSDGGKLLLTSGNEINITSNFTIEAGASAYFIVKECGVP